jgi:predicted  nucleic acid-binding Zn-ribbon protein
MNFELRIDNIYRKIVDLKDQKKQLLNTKLQLENEIDFLKQEKLKYEQKTKELEDRIVNLQVSKTVDNVDKNKLSTVIEELIEEIDKGLDLLKT